MTRSSTLVLEALKLGIASSIGDQGAVTSIKALFGHRSLVHKNIFQLSTNLGCLVNELCISSELRNMVVEGNKFDRDASFAR
jgi:hypothetical protein